APGTGRRGLKPLRRRCAAAALPAAAVCASLYPDRRRTPLPGRASRHGSAARPLLRKGAPMDAASENARFHAPLTRHLLGLGGALTVLLAGLFLPDPFARRLCVFLGTIGLVMGASRYLLSPLVLTLDGDGMTVETPL